MENEIKVSVIIPVYNAEKYLHECLDSVLNQTLKEIEVICVDDGSTDGSLEILREYEKKDSRFKILQQKNSYAGAARNKGIKIAKGEYLIFLDSDDFFDKQMLEKTFTKCRDENAEICFFGANNYNETTKEFSNAGIIKKTLIPKNLPFEGKTYKYIFNITTPNPWNKLIRKSLIDAYNLEFMEIPRTNDYFFIYMAMVLAKRITILDERLLNYRQHSQSLQATNSLTPLSFYEAYKALYESLIKRNLFTGNVRNSFFNSILSGIYYNLYSQKTEKSFNEVLKLLMGDYFNSLGFDNFDGIEILPNDFYRDIFKKISSIKNKEITPKSLKLIIAYHKKDVLFKDEILTPVHAGRAVALKTKDKNDENLKWLLENTTGDDTGDNISEKNSLYNEMTTVYWTWKNYEKIGNPDYVGLMHYRRHFIFKDMPNPYYECEEIDEQYFDKIGYSYGNIQKILTSYDFACAAPQKRDSMYNHFIRNHRQEDIDTTVQIIKDLFPEMQKATKTYLDGNDAYFCNMFIFDKETFFRYGNFVFTVAQELENRLDMTGRRLFISEWLTGIFITKLLQEGKKAKYLATMVAEGEHVIPVALATDDAYAFPMFVTLASLFNTAYKKTYYDIRLLHSEDFSEKNKQKIEMLRELYPQHKITLYNMGTKYSNESSKIAHITNSTYYRLQLPSLLNDVNKCIYLDVDIAVQKDLSELFRINVDEKYMAGVLAAGYFWPEWKFKENLEELEIPDLNQYVNAGVLVLNLKNMRQDNLEEQFTKLLSKKYSSNDQHILNKACYGKIRVISPHYNLMTKYNPQDDRAYYKNKGLQYAYKLDEWEYARKKPTIIHYADKKKPWQDISLPYAKNWWSAASKLPFFSEIFEQYSNAIYSCINNCIKKQNQPKELDQIKKSTSYRVGRTVTWFPRKIKAAIKILKHDGMKGLLKRIKNKLKKH